MLIKIWLFLNIRYSMVKTDLFFFGCCDFAIANSFSKSLQSYAEIMDFPVKFNEIHWCGKSTECDGIYAFPLMKPK